MIFVTVGTHEQPFNRLIKKVDELIGNGSITEDVFMQTGYSTYEPQNCKWSSFLSYKKMNEFMIKADTVISHGGPATFMSALSLGKNTIVVPRLAKFHEHVNNHQLLFVNRLKSSGYGISIINNIEEFDGINFNEIKENNNEKIKLNNDDFNAKFIEKISGLMGNV